MADARVYLPSIHEVDMSDTERMQGKVAWFNNAKGYGFLTHEGGPDVFVHFSSIQTDGYKSLAEGDEVVFSIIKGDKGPQADGVERVKR